MAEEVTLNAGQQTALSILQGTSAQTERTTERLSTGRRVNSAIDDAQAFLLSRNLDTRAAELQASRDDIGQAVSSIGAAQNGLEAISNLTGQLEGIATAARGGTAQERAAAAAQFDEIRNQIDNIARDASFNGTNLIASTPSNVNVSFDENSDSDLTISGSASDTAALGISDATGTNNNFATDADIENALAKVRQASDSIRSTSASFGADAAILNTRDEFAADQVNISRDASDRLVNADLNEEAARQVSLQTRNGLATAGLNIANQSERAVLDLF